MQQTTLLTAETRTHAGTGATRALRRAGRVPAIIYGGKKAPATISLDPRDVTRGINNEAFYATVMHIDVAGQKEQVVPKSVQFHPVTDQPLHVDFLRVDDNTELTVEVAVHLLNTEKCRGVKAGGVLNVARTHVEVVCKATMIPKSFEIDILNYKIGSAVKSSAIELPEGVRFAITDRDFTIATIAVPKGGMGGVSEDENAGAEEDDEDNA